MIKAHALNIKGHSLVKAKHLTIHPLLTHPAVLSVPVKESTVLGCSQAFSIFYF